MVCVLCVAFVYSSSTEQVYSAVGHGRLNTHADGGFATTSQRCGTVRAWERRASCYFIRLSSISSGVGIEAACVEIKRGISRVTPNIYIPSIHTIATIFFVSEALYVTLYEETTFFEKNKVLRLRSFVSLRLAASPPPY